MEKSTRNELASWQIVLLLAGAIGGLLFVFWHVESGALWAKWVLAGIPVLGSVWLLARPKEEKTRIFEAHEEFERSSFGKLMGFAEKCLLAFVLLALVYGAIQWFAA